MYVCISERCRKLIRTCSLNEEIKKRILDPFMSHLESDLDVTFFTLSLLKQGALLCSICNWNFTNIIEEFQYPDLKDSLSFEQNRTNLNSYLICGQNSFLLEEKDLFEPSELIISENSLMCFDKVLTKAECLVESALKVNGISNVENKFVELCESCCKYHMFDPISLSEGLFQYVKDDRCNALLELLKTEYQYVSDINILRNYFLTIRDKEPLDIPSNEMTSIITIINILWQFLEYLLMKFQKSITLSDLGSYTDSLKCHPENEFVEAFRTGSILKAYMPFIQNFSKSIDFIRKNSSSMLKLNSDLSPSRIYQSYMLLPVQRLCRYSLLFQTIRKHSKDEARTPAEKTAIQKLHQACSAAEELAQSANELKREAENSLEKMSFQETEMQGNNLTFYDIAQKCEKIVTIQDLGMLRLFENTKSFIAFDDKIDFEVVTSAHLFERCLFLKKPERLVGLKMNCCTRIDDISLAESNSIRLEYTSEKFRKKHSLIMRFSNSELTKIWVRILNELILENAIDPSKLVRRLKSSFFIN